MESMQPLKLSPEFHQGVEKIGLMRGKLKTLTGLRGIQWLMSQRKMSEKNQEAENRYARRAAWGETPEQAADGNGDDMGPTILGDVTYPTPVVINNPPPSPSPPSGSGMAKLLAGLAIGALIPAVGIGGYMLSQAMKKPDVPAVIPAPTTDDNLDIGLGRFSELNP